MYVINPPNLATLDITTSLIREEILTTLKNSPLIRGVARGASGV